MSLVNSSIITQGLTGFALLAACFSAALAEETPFSVEECKPLAWEITHPTKPGDITLIGSIHLLRRADNPLPKYLYEFVEKADKIVFEIAPSELDNTDATAQLIEQENALQIPAVEQLSPNTVRRLRNLLSDHQLSQTHWDEQALFLTLMTATSLAGTEAGARPEFGVDFQLMRHARNLGKETSGLETVSDQIAIFDDVPVDEIEDVILSTLDDIEAGGAEVRKLIRAWRLGDVEEFYTIIDKSFPNSPVLKQKLLHDRTAKWFSRLEQALEMEGNTLVVVGAAHVMGKDSLLERFSRTEASIERAKAKSRGFWVTRRAENKPK